MALAFEFLFYIGVILVLIGLVWLVRTLFSGNIRRAIAPIGLLVLGAALLIGPAMISRAMVVDLDAVEKMVNNERHITLTGWDGESYDFLANKSDAVVLQMGNADVTDETLDLLSEMDNLRELDLNDSKVTDAGLAKLATLPNLRTLRLRGTSITDGGFREHLMPKESLEQLDLRLTLVSAESVAEWEAQNENHRAFH